MSKVEELAKKYCEGSSFEDACMERPAYIAGYHQAEKDLELSLEDMMKLHIIFTEVDVDIELCKTDIKAETLGYYEEVLNRFNKQKGK